MFKCIVLSLMAISCLSLITSQQDKIDPNFSIGSISDLYFKLSDRIFFRSDDGLFGFITQQNGSILGVYNVEKDEEIIRFSQADEVIIAKNKSVYVFLPSNITYSQSFETIFLAKHPNFTKIIDLIRTADRNSLILTDKYLMQLPMDFMDINETRMKEDILIELTDSSEQFFSLSEFFNIRIGKLDYYLTSFRKSENKSEMCFRKVYSLNESAFCFPIPTNMSVIDVVFSSSYIYVNFGQFVLVMTNLIQFIKKVDARPVQYFKGYVSLDGDHQSFDPATRTISNSKIIVDNLNKLEQIRTMKVEQSELVIQSIKNEEAIDIVKIVKGQNDNPLKVWSYTQSISSSSFKLYIEFDNGHLVCYSIDAEAKKYELLWTISIFQPAQSINSSPSQNANADINE